MVPDQHAAFGITRATQAKKEVQWRDLGLDALIKAGPKESVNGVGAKPGSGSGSRLPR